MRITWPLLLIGGLLGLLCSIALTLFPMHPEEVESQAAVWLSHVGFSEWAEGLTKTTDFWVNTSLWIFLAVAIGLVCVALIRVALIRMRSGDAGAVQRNPGNGWRVSRLMMRVWTLREVESLCQDFLAQPHKADGERVLAARALRQHRAEGGTRHASPTFWFGLEEAEELHGADAVQAAISNLNAEFPPSWPMRGWMSYRQWREKKQPREPKTHVLRLNFAGTLKSSGLNVDPQFVPRPAPLWREPLRRFYWIWRYKIRIPIRKWWWRRKVR